MKYIMLHGLGQTSSSWKNTVKAMNKNESDILCPDLSNWINSEKASYSQLYQELEKYCEQFSEPLNLCGLSLGGILAMQYSIEHSQRVNSLVLIGVQYTMPKRLLQFQNIIFEIMPSSLFKKMGFRKRDLINLSKSMINLNFQHDLNKIRCPVLIICGDKDKANKPASLQLKRLIPHAEISIILQAGHEVNIDTPAELSKELNRYFNNDNCLFLQ